MDGAGASVLSWLIETKIDDSASADRTLKMLSYDHVVEGNGTTIMPKLRKAIFRHH